MKSGSIIALLSVLAVALGTAFMRVPPVAEALTNCTVAQSDLDYDAEEKNFLVLLNQYRAQNGAPALTPSANLNRSAAWMARDLVSRADLPQHVDSIGRDPLVRMQQCDAVAPGGNIAENIAGGYAATGAEILEQWKGSPSHNATMLRADLKQIGIARAYNASNRFPWQWATNFGTVDDGTNIGVPISNPTMNIESPGSANVTSSFLVTGWAIDRAPRMTPASTWSTSTFTRPTATVTPPAPSPSSARLYGARRDDIATAFGSNFANSYFYIQTTALPPGLYLLVVYEHSTVGNSWTPQTRLLNYPG